jgi:hypothetical protein
MIAYIFYVQDNYLPFNLLFDSIAHILRKHFDLVVIHVKHENDIDYADNNIIITLLSELTINMLERQRSNNNHMILVSTELIYSNNYYLENRIELYSRLKLNINLHILEFNKDNYYYYKNNYSHISTIMLPLLYNEHLENYYQDNLNYPYEIPRKDKTSYGIDVLFIGSINYRRQKILDEINQKYKLGIVTIEHGLTNKQLINIINDSRIVINLYFYEAFYFDYYRNSFLIANKVFTVCETPKNIDEDFELNMINYKNYLVTADYDNLVSTIDYYMNQDISVLKDKAESVYNWYVKHNYEDKLVDYMKKKLIF